MYRGRFPGAAIAVMRDGDPIHIESYGLANLAHQVPVTRKMIFELASLSKQMTSATILDLVRRNRIALDHPLSVYVENTPDAWSDNHNQSAGLAHRCEERPYGEFLLN